MLRFAVFLGFSLALSAQTLIIKDATIIDATGAPPRKASVAITGGRITAIGKKLHARRTRHR